MTVHEHINRICMIRCDKCGYRQVSYLTYAGCIDGIPLIHVCINGLMYDAHEIMPRMRQT
jgi:hypothetical protein